MSSKINAGGTAFPMQDPQAVHAYASAAVAGIDDADERDRAYMAARAEAVGGMTMRDYFAAKAMQASLMPAPNGRSRPERSALKGIAEFAYEAADAMLAAREGGAE